ncbi:MAG: hypothetical protein KUG78_10550 [Kangiellaceae bacterium]|nr:hypothetical protein [Kangiellaceae bacterium]
MMKTKRIVEDNPYTSPKVEGSGQNETVVEYQGKVYNILSISIATIFGSVLAAGLLIFSNFSHFEQTRNATIAAVFTAVLTVVFLCGMLIIDFPVVLLFLGLNFSIAAVLLPLNQLMLGNEIEQHEDADRDFHSFARAVLIGVGCLFAMGLMLFFAYTMFLMTF